MRAMTLGALLCLAMSHSAAAACDGQEQLGQVDYAKNSSYFPSTASSQLDKVSKQAQQKGEGYLMLEFNLRPIVGDKKLQQYNMWLANRRIERVKTYLTKNNLTSPIITRINTAAASEQRQVDIVWCTLSEPKTVATTTNVAMTE
ncbi:hypothetical protein L9G74_11835 [Shewanella sp. C32]|uniref:OmpA-like domain-containing protein n=1 Tax=Shewanella electrica TaxID=515560 RepID=A0ABT2FLE8_9GAMM|nr:hypothetical protein [Shewanella electrica]MCS4557133.1 hypothetical protein [Shewanella electrica]